MSYTIKEVDFPIIQNSPQYFKIVELTRDNAKDLSMFIFDDKSPLFEYLVTKEVIRVMHLMSEIGSYHKKLIVVEHEGTKEIVGFSFISVLLNPINLKPINEASIISIVVDEVHRNKGLMRAMIDKMKSIFSGVALTCSPSKADIYKRMGFTISGSFQTHLCMSLGNLTTGAKSLSIDDETVMREPHVRDALNAAIKKHGSDTISRAEKELISAFHSATQEAEKYKEEQ
ncbi:GNAT family N-acetyltransferase [Enterobacter sp. 170198]|uniref:GNAT family N-acetyltransferase n=1 Tax=Enterobacter chinensis TaxID=3030997 RepID=A0ABU5CYF3_9ENTR|nr:GNAT family N-acetyltransferase [Enterobacter sp. 170198]MDY0416674.1 GNAT family N-acetyltransferase [Enterobacter sp. 170198]